MKLVRDSSLAAGSVNVTCVVCGKWRLLRDVLADLDGRAFKDYYCDFGPRTYRDAMEGAKCWEVSPDCPGAFVNHEAKHTGRCKPEGGE